jgi:GAF domain-containing protein
MSALVSSDLRGDAEVRLLLALLKAKGLEEVNEAAISALLSATSADRAAILRFDDDGIIRFKAWRDLSAEYRQAVTGHTPWVRGTRNAQPIAVADVLVDESLAEHAFRRPAGSVRRIPDASKYRRIRAHFPRRWRGPLG